MSATTDAPDESLDPAPGEWAAFRAQGHRMLDDMLDYVEHIRERPVWQTIPHEVRASINEPFPVSANPLAEVYDVFLNKILPYTVGNVHPGFMGWVHGGGTPVGMLADLLASGLNANLGGRDQMPVELERQVACWMRDLFGFPEGASGLFVTGTSMANLMGLLIARRALLGSAVRTDGLGIEGTKLVAYASTAAHGCLARAMDFAGLGTAALHLIAVNDQYQIDTAALEATLAADRAAGLHPFLITGSAGTVDVGAIDDLSALAEIARRESLWFHVDGAYGALGILAPEIAPRLRGIECADSLAFDFHKWGQVPYDAGFLLVRDSTQHLDAFAAPAAYLRREARGLAGGSPWPCDLGPDLSRRFRALATWFTLKVYGGTKLGCVISETCRLARYLGAAVDACSTLERLAPVSLNVVCFRFRCDDPDRDADQMDQMNAAIVADLQESGIAAPSTTILHNRLAIRVAIVNHRTRSQDLDALIAGVLSLGAARLASRLDSRLDSSSGVKKHATGINTTAPRDGPFDAPLLCG